MSNQISIVAMRERLGNAGVELEYSQNKVVSRKLGCSPIRWSAPGYDDNRDRVLLNRIATAYNVNMPAQA